MRSGVRVTPSQPPAGALDPFRRDVVQRREHERPLVHPRVRDLEVGLVDVLVAVEQDVDVQGARSPADRAHPILELLDAIADVEQLARREIGVDRDHRVEEVVLARTADRRGLVDRATPRRPSIPSVAASASTARCRWASRSPRFEPSPRYARVTP